MPSFTFYAAASDGFNYGTDTTWDGARDDATPVGGDTTSTSYQLGASFVTPDYESRVGNMEFDTSSMTGTPTAASFFFHTNAVYSTTPTWEVRSNVWSSGSEFTTGTAYSGKGLLGDAVFDSPGGAAYVEIPVDTPANITASSAFKVTVADSRHASGVAPTASERRVIYSADQSGTTNDPYLSVTTTAQRPSSFGIIII